MHKLVKDLKPMFGLHEQDSYSICVSVWVRSVFGLKKLPPSPVRERDFLLPSASLWPLSLCFVRNSSRLIFKSRSFGMSGTMYAMSLVLNVINHWKTNTKASLAAKMTQYSLFKLYGEYGSWKPGYLQDGIHAVSRKLCRIINHCSRTLQSRALLYTIIKYQNVQSNDHACPLLE